MSSQTHPQVCILVFLLNYKYYICSVGFRPDNKQAKEKMITLVGGGQKWSQHFQIKTTNCKHRKPTHQLTTCALDSLVNTSASMGTVAITGCHIQVLHVLRAICTLNIAKYICTHFHEFTSAVCICRCAFNRKALWPFKAQTTSF